ncbi:hypothetical protein MMU07_04590 [Aquiflexum sp. LQ15W]|uniref:hypothetical protein n=1 Tax=Cognataquiflexum nitidum TaxID=2922272 RepID=UPI001F139BA1|nr:hypothetical protein [Cognataquiflexum nitidum]MCH6198842.1 hypothetical protein [Cognataquiflexum nitidum]
MEDTGTHGLQNVAANFAFDKSQSYFNDKADLKIAGSFLIGSFGGLAQSGIMKERTGSQVGAGTFGKLFGLSTFAYLGEYAANYMWNSSSRPPSLSFSGYYGYKQASYGIKSMFYTYLYWLYEEVYVASICLCYNGFMRGIGNIQKIRSFV